MNIIFYQPPLKPVPPLKYPLSHLSPCSLSLSLLPYVTLFVGWVQINQKLAYTKVKKQGGNVINSISISDASFNSN